MIQPHSHNHTTVHRELAQMARALALGARGREFESRVPDTHNNINTCHGSSVGRAEV